ESIGLGAFGAPVDLDTRGVDHDTVDPLLAQPPMQPPAVSARFVAAAHLCVRLEPASRPGLAGTPENRNAIARAPAVSTRAAAPVAHCQRPALVAQLEAQVQIGADRRILVAKECLG